MFLPLLKVKAGKPIHALGFDIVIEKVLSQGKSNSSCELGRHPEYNNFRAGIGRYIVKKLQLR